MWTEFGFGYRPVMYFMGLEHREFGVGRAREHMPDDGADRTVVLDLSHGFSIPIPSKFRNTGAALVGQIK